MAESRLEKYKEYRNSIISSDVVISKTQIDTDLNASASHIDGVKLSKQEEDDISKLKSRKRIDVILFSLIIVLICAILISFGIICFRGAL